MAKVNKIVGVQADVGKVHQACQELISRRMKINTPDGEYGGNGMWTPSAKEFRDCCKTVPASGLEDHCQTAAHVAALFELNSKEVSLMRQMYEPASVIPDATGGPIRANVAGSAKGFRVDVTGFGSKKEAFEWWKQFAPTQPTGQKKPIGAGHEMKGDSYVLNAQMFDDAEDAMVFAESVNNPQMPDIQV
jgi:hypothetical protein